MQAAARAAVQAAALVAQAASPEHRRLAKAIDYGRRGSLSPCRSRERLRPRRRSPYDRLAAPAT
eukprot:5741006-Prymnesium_polylepis.1